MATGFCACAFMTDAFVFSKLVLANCAIRFAEVGARVDSSRTFGSRDTRNFRCCCRAVSARQSMHALRRAKAAAFRSAAGTRLANSILLAEFPVSRIQEGRRGGQPRIGSAVHRFRRSQSEHLRKFGRQIEVRNGVWERGAGTQISNRMRTRRSAMSKPERR